MGILGWIVLGLIMGALAKAVLPGKAGGGWLATLLLGIVGAIVGGLLGTLFWGGEGLTSFFSIRTWVLAFVGSIIVLAIYGAIKGRSGTRSA